LAIKPVDNESFYREVDEELRRDQMKTWWQRRGKLVIAGIVLILAAIGGFIWWQNQQQVKAAERSQTLLGAYDDIAGRNKAAATAKLDQLAKEGSEGHRAAALLTKADLAIEANDLKGAAGLFRQVAEDKDLAQPYRDLATVRRTAVEYDSLSPQAVVERLKPLAVAGQPWFGSAGEMLAVAYIRLNRPKEAANLFAAMAKDKKVPETLRSRATQMAGALGVDAVQEAPEATQEGTQ
jgi:hypothetical protein